MGKTFFSLACANEVSASRQADKQSSLIRTAGESVHFAETKGSFLINRRKGHGFTLIELLVVIAIIVILAAMLLPSLSTAKEQAKKMTCCANMKSMVVLENQYSDTYGYFIPQGNTLRPNPYYSGLSRTSWQDAMRYEYDSNIHAAIGNSTPIPAFMRCPNGIPSGARYYQQTYYGGRHLDTTVEVSRHGLPLKDVKHPSAKMCMMDFSNYSSRHNYIITKEYYIPGAGSFQNPTVQGYIQANLSTFSDQRFLEDLQRGRHFKSVNLYYFDGHIGSITSAEACNYFYISKTGIDNPFDIKK